MERAVICIVNDSAQAERAVGQLRNAGFATDSISVREDEARRSQRAGGALGGMGWWVGIGSLAFLGLGPFIATGPTYATLSSAAIGAALGALAVSLVGRGSRADDLVPSEILEDDEFPLQRCQVSPRRGPLGR
jgi:hypothetical protein